MAQILVIEDDDLMMEMYQDFFERRGDKTVCYARGNMLIGDLNRNGGIVYDLAITDRTLPDISGDIIVDKLKQRYPQRPIIKISGRDYPCPYGLRPSDSFLDKPFDLKELGDLVDRLLKFRQR